MPNQSPVPKTTRGGSPLLRTACIGMRASECVHQNACIRMRGARPLCPQGHEVRSNCYGHRSSDWREDAGETPAVQDGTLCSRFESNLLLATLSSLRSLLILIAFIPQIPVFCGQT